MTKIKSDFRFFKNYYFIITIIINVCTQFAPRREAGVIYLPADMKNNSGTE